MIINNVFTKKQTIIPYSVKELMQLKLDDRLSLRETNIVQVRAIRKYIFDNILTEQIYLPPIVMMLEEGTLEDGKPQRLIVVDGTQRMKALTQLDSTIVKMINSEDKEEQRKGHKLHYTLGRVEIAVQIFEGLSKNEADQLYIDLNTKGKKVSLSKRIAYDSRNEINQTTNRILESNELLVKAGVEQEKHAVMRPKNKKLLSLSQLRQIVSLFVTGKTIGSNVDSTSGSVLDIENNQDLINTWFDELFALYPYETIGDYEESMLASFTLLLAVASYAMEGVKEFSFVEKKEEIQRRMKRLEEANWTRDSSMWRAFNGSIRGREKYFYLDNDKKTIQALVAWLQTKGGE